MSDDSELVERVARAIYETDAIYGPAGELQKWEDLPDRNGAKVVAWHQAFAAIKAARPLISRQAKEEMAKQQMQFAHDERYPSVVSQFIAEFHAREHGLAIPGEKG